MNDHALLARIERLLNEAEEEDQELSEAQLRAIDEGLKALDAGQRVPHDEARKLYAKWL